MKLKLSFVSALILSLSQAIHAAVLSTEVQGIQNRTCFVQLRLPEEDEKTKIPATGLPIFFSQNGTGIYSMFDDRELSPAAEYLLKEDKNVSAAAVMAFESWNTARLMKDGPALFLSARYYQARHRLNLTAVNDMIMVMKAYLGP